MTIEHRCHVCSSVLKEEMVIHDPKKDVSRIYVEACPKCAKMKFSQGKIEGMEIVKKIFVPEKAA
jgi:hypothetical protein